MKKFHRPPEGKLPVPEVKDKFKSWRRDAGKQEQKRDPFTERPGFYKGARVK